MMKCNEVSKSVSRIFRLGVFFLLAFCFVSESKAEFVGPGYYGPNGQISNIRQAGVLILSASEYGAVYGGGTSAAAITGTAIAVKTTAVLSFALVVAGGITYGIDCAINDGVCIDTAIQQAGGLQAVISGGNTGAIRGATSVACSLRGSALYDACLNATASIDSGIPGYFSNYNCGEIIRDGRYGMYAAAFDMCMAEVAGCVNRTQLAAVANPTSCDQTQKLREAQASLEAIE